MSRSRILGSLATAALGVALLGACSAESLTERAVEAGLEQAAEGGQDIDLDFNDDGSGGFSISTEDGEFSINVDEDAGSITFDTDDGEGAINFDEEDGTVSVSADDDSFSVTSDAEIPEDWPSIIGVPTTLVPGSALFNTVEIEGVAAVISAAFEHATGDPFGAEVAARLKADGWDGDVVPTSDGGVGGTLRKDGASVQIIADPNFAQVTYSQPVS